MTLDANKQLVRRYIEEVLNRGDLEAIDALFAPPLNDQVRRIAIFLRSAFPDMHETLHDLVAEDDKVMARWTFRGTHLGQWHEFPPTGKAVEMVGFSIYIVRDGRIVNDQAVMDMVAGLEAIGVTFVLPGASSLPVQDEG
jgi:predicted ester cyclase